MVGLAKARPKYLYIKVSVSAIFCLKGISIGSVTVLNSGIGASPGPTLIGCWQLEQQLLILMSMAQL